MNYFYILKFLTTAVYSSSTISACTAEFTAITAATFFCHFAMFLVFSGTTLFALFTCAFRAASSDFSFGSHYIIIKYFFFGLLYFNAYIVNFNVFLIYHLKRCFDFHNWCYNLFYFSHTI